jgi:transposase InsO family protein
VEAKELARVEHESNGHFGRDLIKISLLDRICSPRLDKSITAAIIECGRCKAFGGQHLAALLEPITRRHPWELFVGDYLSMPVGIGGFHTVGLYMDVYLQKIFGFKFTGYGTTATTISSLEKIRQLYRVPEVFMADGGTHFSGHAVAEWCENHGSRYQQVAAYSPWVNGLLEGTNGKLLSRLKRLCAPNLGEDDWALITKFEDLPAHWPKHFDTAIEQLNQRILPAYKFSPNELCLGLVVNTSSTPIETSTLELEEGAVGIQNKYVAQQGLDAYSHIVEHANKRKAAFDKRVRASKDGVIEYKKGDLVQIRDSKRDLDMATDSKLLPQWGAPHRIIDCIRNSYRLAMIQGLSLGGTISARRLRRFIPRLGTELAREQAEIESRREGVADEIMEGLDFEEEEVDKEEGEVEDIDFGRDDLGGV